MKIVHVVPSLSPAAGGPTRAVLQLTDALAASDAAQVRLITQSAVGHAIASSNSPLVGRLVGDSRNGLTLALGLPGRRVLTAALNAQLPDLLHANGIWHPLNHWCASTARRRGIPLVIHPRGMLEPWALAWKGGKKRLALALYQRRDLESAALLVATAEKEAEHFRQFGLRQPIALVPNGIDLQGALSYCTVLRERAQGIRRALFLGRIHPVKGLVNLMEAWASVAPAGWHLQLAGPDADGHLGEIRRLSRRLGISEQVQYLGELDDAAKWAVYRQAELFVLPSFTENFGVVVAEALAAGLPVITTTGTPWQDLQTYGCGWWVAPSVGGLNDALSDAMRAPYQCLREMGERGRNYVQRYDWSHIAVDMLDVYRWVLGRGPRPDYVRID